MIMNTGLVILFFCLVQQVFEETNVGKFQEYPAWRFDGLPGFFF